MIKLLTSRVEHYFTHGIGHGGAEVPIDPTEVWPWTWVVILFVALTLGIMLIGVAEALGWVAAQALIGEFRAPAPDALAGAARWLLPIAVGGAACCLALPVFFWPITRRQVGCAMEDQTREWSRERLDDVISKCGVDMRSAAPFRKEAYRRRLAWLYSQRMQLHGVGPPDHLRKDVMLL